MMSSGAAGAGAGAASVHVATQAQAQAPNSTSARRRSFCFSELPVPPPSPLPLDIESEESSEATTTTSSANYHDYYSVEDFPNQSLFDVTIPHPAVSVPVKKTGAIRTLLKSVLAKGIKNTYTPDDAAAAEQRILVLQPGTTQSQMEGLLVGAALIADAVDTTDLVQWIPEFPVTRTYHDQSADELLRKLLPADYEIPSSFELVGPIAHVNLKDVCLPYKYWIGKILMDRTPPVQIVVNKVGTIDTVYRTFDMEVLAGDTTTNPNWSVVTVHEHGSAFQLDYRHVYWNSRLSGEHTRLVDLILKQQQAEKHRSLVVADLMAGVGPFAIPLTRQQTHRGSGEDDGPTPPPPVIVYANDLNPVSFQYLQINAKTNKCRNLHCYNQDARAFVHWLQHPDNANTIQRIDHVIMNLPASAPEFLNAFRGWSLGISSSPSPSSSFLPTVHVHCFAPKAAAVAAAAREEEDGVDSYYATAIQRCERALGCPIEPGTARIHIVRNVSPSNNMLCISFPLPWAVTQLERITLLSSSCSTTTTTTNSTTSVIAAETDAAALGDPPAAKRTKVQ